MAGLGRVQQLFNRAVVGTLAALIGIARGGKEEAKRLAGNGGHGHPLLAKLIKCSAPRANTPGHDYPGYLASSMPKVGRNLRPVGYKTRPSSLRRVWSADKSTSIFNRSRKDAA